MYRNLFTAMDVLFYRTDREEKLSKVDWNSRQLIGYT